VRTVSGRTTWFVTNSPFWRAELRSCPVTGASNDSLKFAYVDEATAVARPR
jgi:hypothetical protein